jgi:hypothetical protein
MKSKQSFWSEELEAKLGFIPDSVFADLTKALSLNGRIVASLDRDETEVFTFFRDQGQQYGVAASVVGEEGSTEAAVSVKITPAEQNQ